MNRAGFELAPFETCNIETCFRPSTDSSLASTDGYATVSLRLRKESDKLLNVISEGLETTILACLEIVHAN